MCGAPPQGLKKMEICVKRRATIRYEGRARWEARVPVVESVHEMLLFAGLDSGRVRDDRGIEEGAALLGFGGALREEVLLVLRRHPGITPGLPHMRLADIEGGLCHERAPRIQGVPATTAASKRARRCSGSAARCAKKHRLSSGNTRVSHRGCRTCGWQISKWGFVTSVRHLT